jgi:Ternary complex associated domain 9
MLRRAFHDCQAVHLQSLDTGNSGVGVYLAHVTSGGPRRPLPFFVKVGQRDKIRDEWRHYSDHVHGQIPFYLSPKLVEKRCHLGAHSGIIVGDFVEHSESLLECARGGRAMAPIATLFERTLRHWQFEASEEDVALAIALPRWTHGRLDSKRLSLASSLGKTLKTKELRAILDHRRSEATLWGSIHGDLHADNVRVRRDDAIVIDFLSTVRGPLLADPAALEVSLVIRAPADTDFDQEAWSRVVEPLYSTASFRDLPKDCDPTEPYAWISACVRQIRLHAFAMERAHGQYAAVVARRLLHTACKDPKASPAENFRRATAYLFASQLALFEAADA